MHGIMIAKRMKEARLQCWKSGAWRIIRCIINGLHSMQTRWMLSWDREKTGEREWKRAKKGEKDSKSAKEYESAKKTELVHIESVMVIFTVCDNPFHSFYCIRNDFCGENCVKLWKNLGFNDKRRKKTNWKNQLRILNENVQWMHIN